MRYALSIFAAILAALSAVGATTPLDAAAKYAFTDPVFSNAIRGVVLGNQGRYGTIRYEDAAFLREAFAERRIVASAATDADFLRAVGDAREMASPKSQHAKIGGEAYAPPTSRYAAIGNALISAPHVIAADEAVPYAVRESFLATVTNTVAVTNLVTQTLTNGVVDVWTNVIETVTSNLVPSVRYVPYETSLGDWCFSTTNRIKWPSDLTLVYSGLHDSQSPAFFNRTVFSRLYVAAKNMTRTVAFECGAAFVSGPNAMYRSSSESGTTGPTPTASEGYAYSATRRHETTIGTDGSETSNVTTWSAEQTTLLSSVYYDVTVPLAPMAATYGGSAGRYSALHAFAVIGVARQDTWSVYATGPGSTGGSSNVTARVMVPVEAMSFNPSGVTFRATVRLPDLRSAADAAAIPFLSMTDLPTLPPGRTPFRPAGRTASTFEQATMSLSIAPAKIYVVLDLSFNSTWSN